MKSQPLPHIAAGLALACGLLSPALPARADEADARVKAALDAEKITYEISPAKNFRVIFDYTDDKRSQLVIINSSTSDFHGVSWRDVYSEAFSVKGPLSAQQANALLADSDTHVFGAWCTDQKEGMTHVYYQVAIPATASPKDLHNAISLVASAADEMEKKITKKDDN
jgi:hypothetical protein